MPHSWQFRDSTQHSMHSTAYLVMYHLRSRELSSRMFRSRLLPSTHCCVYSVQQCCFCKTKNTLSHYNAVMICLSYLRTITGAKFRSLCMSCPLLHHPKKQAQPTPCRPGTSRVSAVDAESAGPDAFFQHFAGTLLDRAVEQMHRAEAKGAKRAQGRLAATGVWTVNDLKDHETNEPWRSITLIYIYIYIHANIWCVSWWRKDCKDC